LPENSGGESSNDYKSDRDAQYIRNGLNNAYPHKDKGLKKPHATNTAVYRKDTAIPTHSKGVSSYSLLHPFIDLTEALLLFQVKGPGSMSDTT
jgi:hypothetical protein